MITPIAYLKYKENQEAGGDAGAHVFTTENGLALYCQYHSTILFKYKAHGIRQDLLDWAARNHITWIYAQVREGKTYRTTIARLLREGTLDELGGKGPRYYLSFDEWEEVWSLDMGWTNHVLTLADDLV